MSSATEQPAGLQGTQGLVVIGTVTVGHATVHWFGAAFVLLLAEIVASLGLGPLAAGTVIGARSFSGALANAPMGVLADRFSGHRAWFMAVALAWLGVSFFLVGLSPSFPVLVAFAAVLGIAGALWHPPAIGFLSTRFPDRRAFALAVNGVGASFGDITGPLVVGGLLLVVSWESIFRFSFLPVVAAAVVFLLIMRGTAGATAPGHRSMGLYFASLRDAAKDRDLLLALIASGTRSAGQLVVVAFLPLYARSELGLQPGFVGVLLALLLGMSMISQPILGYLSDRTSRKAVILPGVIVLTVLTPWIGFISNQWVLLALVSVIGLFLFSMATLLGALALDIAPAGLASSTTAAQFLLGLGVGSIAPVVAGAIGRVAGIETTFFVATALFALTVPLVAILPKTQGKGPTPRMLAG
jgi:MFS family permease